MRNVDIVEAEARHVPMVVADLRPSYLDALRHTGLEPKAVVWRCYRASALRRTAFVDGRVAAMWGCCPAGGVHTFLGSSLLGGVGDGWLFTTSAVRLAPKAALRIGREELARFRAAFGVLRGIVSVEDECAARFARHLGCTLGDSDGLFRPYEVM